MSSALRPPVSASSPPVRSWPVESSNPTAGADAVAVNEPRAARVDEHVWRHTRKGDKYVTVIIDLTPIRDRSGPARLLDMVEGRSKQVFKEWLAARPEAWREAIEVVARYRQSSK